MLAPWMNLPYTAGRPNAFMATAIVTAPTIWSTAAATGGPLLYNATGSGVTAYLLAVSFGLTVASTVAGAIGITGGPSTAPASTTAIDSIQCTRLHTNPPTPGCQIFRSGTVSAAGTFFHPIGQIGTSALTAEIADDNWVHLGGAIELDYGYFLSISPSATLTTAVLQIGMIWAEVPKS